MNQARIPGIEACVFDAYGTLFDFTSAAERCRESVGPNWERLSQLWRDKQLQYTWLRAVQGSYVDFWQVTGDALDFALDTLGIGDSAVRERLMSVYLELDPFPEVAEVLQQLKTAGSVTAILSNGSHRMLRSVIENAGLSDLLDHVLSVDDVGVFKPHPSVYRLATERLRLPPAAISFQSSNAWDAHAASAFGFRVVWCNRYSQPPERLPGAPDREIRTLGELPRIVLPG